MKVRVMGLVLLCVGLVFFGITNQGLAKLDSKTIAAMWLFDDGSGTTAIDSSGNEIDAELIDGPEWVEGKFGGGIEFNGTGAHFVTPDFVNPSDAITMSIWVKATNPTWGQHGWVMEKRDALILHNVQGGRNMGFCVANGAPWNQPHSWDTGAVGPDDITEWHMYTGTFDGATGEWYIYIDGEEESALECNANPIVEDQGPMFIGSDT